MRGVVDIMEYGGYLPFELRKGKDYFSDQYSVLKLNSGRAALAAAVKESNIKKIWIPYYNCNVVYKMLSQYCNCMFYYLDKEMNPIIDNLSSDEWILVVNYFGNRNGENLTYLKNKYKRIIIDNTQAFFSAPISGCFNIYSCRKFFGVSDGAYLVTDKGYNFKNSYKRDVSWKRCNYLLRSIEEGTNAAYQDSIHSEEDIAFDINEMSILTNQIMQSIDYDCVLKRRRANQKILVEELGNINEITIRINDEDLIAYPLLVRDDKLRTELVRNKIYVPQWWKYLKDIVKKETVEYEYSAFLNMIPLDQRYEENDIMKMVNIIKKILYR